MNLEEYKASIEGIKIRHKREINELHLEYVLSVSEFKKGDIIYDESTNTRIIIEDIKPYLSYGESPVPAYFGEALKANLTPFKKPHDAVIHGNRELKKLNK